MLLRFRKVGSESLISGSLCPRCSGNVEGDIRNEPGARSPSASIYYLMTEMPDVERNIDARLFGLGYYIINSVKKKKQNDVIYNFIELT